MEYPQAAAYGGAHSGLPEVPTNSLTVNGVSGNFSSELADNNDFAEIISRY